MVEFSVRKVMLQRSWRLIFTSVSLKARRRDMRVECKKLKSVHSLWMDQELLFVQACAKSLPSKHPSLYQNIEAFLLVEPSILGDPGSFGVLELDVVPLHNQRYNLMNLTQGNLNACQQSESHCVTGGATHALANTSSGATSKHQVVSVQCFATTF